MEQNLWESFQEGKDSLADRKRYQLNLVTLTIDTRLRFNHIRKFADSLLVIQLTEGKVGVFNVISLLAILAFSFQHTVLRSHCRAVTTNVEMILQLLFKKYLFFSTYYVPLSEKAMAPHSSALAWKIPWMEEPGGLQSMGSRRVGHD